MAGKFEPKVPVNLDPPKDDIISLEELAKADGSAGQKAYVAIKGKIYDVSANKAYREGGSYHVFAGKDASRALAKTSTKADDVRPEWEDLGEKEKQTLSDWDTFFSKRYNVIGILQGANNLE
ncbi:cytochrome b5 [Durotheca rogersii]|uniref:cytochrome b5 n=1 Tax=Durotheca rogersii TaxID=419775 RepID=UPI0022204415|nr:cytochrome b5 [Durotheca rogersii]KAI5858177.1 cytochrome b5 [Durotheca rogersii]